MRFRLRSLFMTNPFDSLQEHAEKVKECAWSFQQAIECHLTRQCQSFEEFRAEVIRLETEADAIKQKALNLPLEPMTAFHRVRLAEAIGRIADHAENAGDMMRAMLAR